MKNQIRGKIGMEMNHRGSWSRWTVLASLLFTLWIAAACLAQATPDETQQRAQNNQNSTLKTYDPGPPTRPVLRARPVVPEVTAEGSSGNGEATYSATAQPQAPAPIAPPPPPTDPPPPPVQSAPMYMPQTTPATMSAPTGQASGTLNPLDMKGPLDRPAAKPKTNPKTSPKPGQPSAGKANPAKPATARPAKPASRPAHPAGTLNPLDMKAPAGHGNAAGASGMAGVQGPESAVHAASAQDLLSMPDPVVHAAPAPAAVAYTPSPELAAAEAQVTTAQQTCSQAADYAAYFNGMASNPEGMREGLNQMLQVLVEQTTDADRRAELQAAMNGAAPNDSVLQQLQNLAEAAQSICTAQTISAQKAMDAVQGKSKGAPAPLAAPAPEYAAPTMPQQYPPQPY